MYLVPLLIVLIINIFFVRILFNKKMFASLMTPAIYILVSIYSFVGVFIFDFALTVPFDFFDGFSKNDILDAIFVFLYAGIVLSVSSIIPTFYINRKKSIGSSFNIFLFIRTKCEKISDFKLILVSLLSSFFIICAVGPSDILIKHGYMGTDNILFLKLYTFSLPMSSFAISLIKKRYIRYTLFLLALIIMFSTSSRSILILPFIYMFGSMIRHNRIVYFRIFILVCLAMILSGISLEYRSHPVQGIIGNGFYLLTHGFNPYYISLGMNYLFSYSVSLLTFMMNTVKYDPEIFWLSINPLPGFMLDLRLIIENAKANVFAPYSTIGEAYLMGGFYFTLFYSFIGFTIGSTEYKASNNLVCLIFIFVLTLLFCFLSLQYNIRGTIRFIYVLLFLNVFMSLLDFLRKHFHK